MSQLLSVQDYVFGPPRVYDTNSHARTKLKLIVTKLSHIRVIRLTGLSQSDINRTKNFRFLHCKYPKITVRC